MRAAQRAIAGSLLIAALGLAACHDDTPPPEATTEELRNAERQLAITDLRVTAVDTGSGEVRVQIFNLGPNTASDVRLTLATDPPGPSPATVGCDPVAENPSVCRIAGRVEPDQSATVTVVPNQTPGQPKLRSLQITARHYVYFDDRPVPDPKPTNNRATLEGPISSSCGAC
jgi:hypothetical protein